MIDDQGRTTQVTTTIRRDNLDAGLRNCYQQKKAGACGIDGDEGGHLIATKLGGPGERINLVPQNMNLNRGEWKKMENEWARAAAEGKVIEVKIDVIYEQGSQRPSQFRVTYSIDGVKQKPRKFRNRPGG